MVTYEKRIADMKYIPKRALNVPCCSSGDIKGESALKGGVTFQNLVMTPKFLNAAI